MITNPYQAKYVAYELTKQTNSASIGKLASTLADAQVDLTPHQVEAALFAFRSPLSKGAILADEVGLGKTIEAGLVIAQKWAERKRRILIIVPANLRKQWSQELQDKFFLPSIILEKKSFEEEIHRTKNFNPFDNREKIVICSYNFAKAKDTYIEKTYWDLIVLDEAHKLRNVYKSSNKIARAIRDAIQDKPKILLTATPLQNSLMELYGLVSIIDEYIFGDQRSFKAQFARLTPEHFQDLKDRLKPICNRTLRKQVLEYVKYTNRHAITEDFYPSDQEWELYKSVTDYLQRPRLYALPQSQRSLMTLILRRLLASSTFAIKDTFVSLSNRLKEVVERHKDISIEAVEEDFIENFDAYEELKDDFADEEDYDEDVAELEFYTPIQLAEIQEEITLLDSFATLAASIQTNSKGEVLLTALRKGFEKLRELSAPEKAIIFTESVRTQGYLYEILNNTPEYKDSIVLFNGTNSDQRSRQIYKQWAKKYENTDRITGSPTSDKRAALVEYFKEKGKIMIATEAGAEGINLQFCALVVNYDLPWNPQRIEQRIGRCHRYGQQHDVVVVNFINRRNAADERVFNLLNEKFQLFDGVFGASDQVLGAIQSGVDFEKRIATIYQNCRSTEDIQTAFDHLRDELDHRIQEAMSDTHQKLFENFDVSVLERIKVESEEYIGRYQNWLWQITQFLLKDKAIFTKNEKGHSFYLNAVPSNLFDGTVNTIHLGPYIITSPLDASDNNRAVEENANVYRVGHPLAQRLLSSMKQSELPFTSLLFQYDAKPKNAAIEPYLGQSGFLRAVNVRLTSAVEVEDHIALLAFNEDGEILDSNTAKYLINLAAIQEDNEENQTNVQALEADFETILKSQAEQFSSQSKEHYNKYFTAEIDKLDRWAEDLRNGLRVEIKNLEIEIKQRRAESRRLISLEEKIKIQREIKNAERKLAESRNELYEAENTLDQRKEVLIDEIEAKINTEVEHTVLFTISWKLEKI